jgi:uncharacterized protein (UPF0305 family)
MNPIIISTIIGVANFILTISSAIYLNQRHADKLVEQLEKRFDERINDLKKWIEAEFKAMRAEIATSRAESKFENELTRGEVIRLRERTEKNERQLDPLFKLVVPGIGD